MSKSGQANSSTTSHQSIDYLLTARAVRERCQQIFDLALKGQTHFSVHLDRLEAAADYVIGVIQKNYPDLKIPYHSRWNHFRAGGVDRVQILNQKLESLSSEEKSKAWIDLVVVSVLLDAGAGMEWKFQSEGKSYGRSEGLALASFEMFCRGEFSNNPADPFRVDASALIGLKLDVLKKAFQVDSKNPLAGLEGRRALLQSLGRTLQTRAEFATRGDDRRPGNLISAFDSKKQIRASELLELVLKSLGEIWPGRIRIQEISLGDTWHYPPLGPKNSLDSLIPFHKLSQWLTYSLIEPFEWSGFKIVDLDSLTGLPEYRNGGLFLDLKVLNWRTPDLAHARYTPDSEVIIEWRALTVILLDRIAQVIRKKLGKSELELPLAKILEGGTWWAGRKIAAELRKDGSPPVLITSDGTVF